MLDRSIAPHTSLPEYFEIVKAQTVYLGNDLPLHIVKAGNQEVIRLELVFNAGVKYETIRGVSYFTSKMLAEGTNEFTSAEIIDYLDFYGAFYELNHGPDSINLTFYTLKKYLKEVALMAKRLISTSIFPIEELDNLKNITLQNLRVNLNKTSFLASHKFKEVLFGANHAYGKTLLETDIDSISAIELRGFYSTHIDQKNFDIFLSGDADSNSREIISSIFGTSVIYRENSATAATGRPYIPSSDLVIVEKEDNIQSSIRLGCLSIPKTDSDYFKFAILNEILGGYFGSRLMKNIREEKGLTYGISSSAVNYREGSYFVIGTDVKKENAQQTLDEIEKEINILKSIAVPVDELETVKNYLIGSFLASINSPFSLADKFKSIYFYNLDYDFYQNYLTSIKNCTTRDLLETANKYLDYPTMSKVVVGGI